jgi:hypothetical protein
LTHGLPSVTSSRELSGTFAKTDLSTSRSSSGSPRKSVVMASAVPVPANRACPPLFERIVPAVTSVVNFAVFPWTAAVAPSASERASANETL